MNIQIDRCYDSHVHLLATGQMRSTLQLRHLNSPSELATMEIRREFHRGDWLYGFGWNQHRFPGERYPTRQDLDVIFPSIPVAFSRGDGHAMWVNSEALKRAGLFKPVAEWSLPPGGEAFQDEKGWPTGILIDRAMEIFFQLMPSEDLSLKKDYLKAGVRAFNEAGFTHLRDMAGDEDQWQALRDLDDARELSIYVDQNFVFDRPEDFDRTLEICGRAAKDRSPHLKVRGIKFYLDGALGSEGASLSEPYAGTDQHGLLLWTPEQISGWLRKTWESGFEIAIHALGDRASEIVVAEARKLWERGLRGFLNLEHIEVMRSETLRQLPGCPVRLHMQPCHWLTDRVWLKAKLGDLHRFAFPWKEVADLGLDLCWGSDSPIEPPSLEANRIALAESAPGIPAYPGEWWKPHVHPDAGWGPDCRTRLENGRVTEVIFDGDPLHL